jgi:hypothetical protein
MKLIASIVKLFVWVVVLAVVVVLALPLWIGPVAKFAANTYVPKVTKTGFHLGEFGLNQYSGSLRIGDMQLQNPERFFTDSEKSAKALSEVKGDGVLGTALAHAGNAVAAVGDTVAAVGDALASSETNAVSLKSLDVRFSTTSILSDTVKIKEIVIDGLYFYGDLTFSNIREIADNATGQKTRTVEKKAEPENDDGKNGKDGKKVQIDRVLITGAKIQWGHVAVPLPDIEIKDIGKEDGGADAESAWDTILNGFCDAADKVCTGAGTALKLAIEGVDAAKNAVGSVIEGAGSTLGDAVDSGKKALDGAKDLGKGALDGAKDLGKGALDAGKDAVGAGINAVKGFFN